MKKLSQKVVKLLSKKRLKISLAESCTGGLLSSSITSISGSSKVFTLGLITYSNQTKIKITREPIKQGDIVVYTNQNCLYIDKKAKFNLQFSKLSSESLYSSLKHSNHSVASS